MNKKSAWLLISAADVVFLHCAASANDTTTYTYDALGRLIRRQNQTTSDHPFAINVFMAAIS